VNPLATQKITQLRLGAGNLNQFYGETAFLVGQRAPLSGSIQGITDWNSATPYSFNQPVTYLGVQYKSTIPGIATNLNNIPTVTGWVQVDGKDGDLWIQVPPGTNYTFNSSLVGLFQKSNGLWLPMGDSATFAYKILDNTSGTVFTYPALLLPYANFVYTLRRQTYPEVTPNYSQEKQGTYIIQNDGSNLSYTHQFQEIGNDVGCTITPTLSGANVNMNYVASNQGQDLEFQFNLSGWATASL